MILNLGSGTKPVDGAVNCDRFSGLDGVNCIVDLEFPLPFPDNTFTEVAAYHILEHIHKLPELLGEIYRVCKNDAVVHIDVPHYTNPTFWDDPSHVRPWSENTANFICEQSKYGKLGFQGKFRVLHNEMLGEPYSREKPTVVIVKLQVVKGE